jgi:hypothetical protein
MISLADSIQSLDVFGLAGKLKSMVGSALSLKDRHPGSILRNSVSAEMFSDKFFFPKQ